MIYCEIIPAHEAFNLIKKNIPQHYSDACEKYEYQPVDIDWDYYEQLGKQNKCFVVTLNKDKETIGYSIYTLSNDPIRKMEKEAENICIYVVKKYRGIATFRLIKKAHEFLKKLGAKEINYAVKNESLQRVLSRIGGKNSYNVWSVAA